MKNKPIIYFVRDFKSYLPEISAYEDYCYSNGIEYKIVSSSFEFSSINRPYIKWMIMGVNKKRDENSFIVHEFLSLSTGKFPRLKNYIKRHLSVKPDFQVFLNKYVKNEFIIKSIPFAIRDMGIDDSFVFHPDVDKSYDFVYCGSLGKNRNISVLFDAFQTGAFKNFSLLIIGEASNELIQRYQSNNICFLGRVQYRDVPRTLAKARCAINFIPDTYPFNVQTSTKLLEYLACGLPVVSTKYKWVDCFNKKHKSPILFINDKLTDELIYDYIYSNHHFPDMTEYSWDSIISEAGIFEKVLKGFNKKFNEECIK
ncbi:glycosyltransferase [Vibrio parahaemolyticus]|uniref:glycosyltransferase n=1 Tax=Vibrio harveyi group TaxID=717610 RepID=UPI00186A731D|nr:glycosyltransferase [Vibrio parahaemolyticus]EJX1243927.1 glycosyltransferase [Vibrio alginolyticus]EME0110804.1 glycosyltransferase [Vibrio parahaemolyticus]MBE4180689.1 glycosyltransferase family 4 protein [Vibrio parahaemolyticus]MDG2748319.1 glycosyltransferase [Vibrio parahaemolyticus]